MNLRNFLRTTAQVVGVRVIKRTNTAKAHATIRDVIVANPTLSYQQIADLLGCSRWLVYAVARERQCRSVWRFRTLSRALLPPNRKPPGFGTMCPRTRY